MFELISEAYHEMIKNVSDKQKMKDISIAQELENK